MKGSWVGLAMRALVMVAGLLCFPSCGFKRQLVAITINPPEATIMGAGIQVDFQAIGTYIHPPDTRIITDSVVWTSAAPQVVGIVSNTGVATSGDVCGTNITITATGHSDPHDSASGVVVGTALVNVKLPPTC
jgi:hypothetical protein